MHEMPVTHTDRSALGRERTDPFDALARPGAVAGTPPPPAPAPGRYLAVQEGLAQRLVALSRPITHVGRGISATVQLDDPGVSRRHAILVQRRGGVRILDDRSTNGTFVNGRRVLEAELRDG